MTTQSNPSVLRIANSELPKLYSIKKPGIRSRFFCIVKNCSSVSDLAVGKNPVRGCLAQQDRDIEFRVQEGTKRKGGCASWCRRLAIAQ